MDSALKDYAKATHSKILKSQADLDPKAKALSSMLSWCREQSCIVVLNNHIILCSDPLSRLVPNCKTVMINKQLKPGQVFAATPSLINIILENGETDDTPTILLVKQAHNNSAYTTSSRTLLCCKQPIYTSK